MNKTVFFNDLGTIEYNEAWQFQEKIFSEITGIKMQNRNSDTTEQKETPNYLFLCEHPHVYTIGKSGKIANLLVNEEFLRKIGATCFHINRGGDITYHGPGQIVGYPIFDLDNFEPDIHLYMRNLEEVIIRTLADFELKGERLKGATGVWIDAENPLKARKICAMGVRASRWVTMHGFALNVNTNLKYFDYINPCGFTDKGVTSIEKEIGAYFNLDVVKESIKKHFIAVFNINLINFKS